MERSEPAYSVVTPVYNAAATLPAMVQALLRLDPPPHAVYLVDDASTDDSREIARRYPAVTCVPLPVNGGQSRARNVGARMADTELLLMIDSDCYVDRDGFRAAYEHLVATPGLTGIMGVPARDAPPGPFAGRFKNYWYHLEFNSWGDVPRTLYGSCFLMRRDAYLAVGGFDESFGHTPCEDAEFYFRLVREGCRFERRMEFSFVHDKAMTLGRLLRTSFERSVSIIRNLHGKLGEQGTPWKPHEQLRWALEIGSGSAVSLGLVPALAAAALLLAGILSPPASTVAATIVAAWLLSAAMFLACIRDKLAFASHDKGLAFAAGAFACRALEMPAAALGIVVGSLLGRAIRPIYERPGPSPGYGAE